MRDSIYAQLSDRRSYTKSAQWQRLYSLNGLDYLCDCDAVIKRWENDEQCPALDFLWPIQAWDKGGHQVINLETLAKLHGIVTQWLVDDCCETVVEIMEKGQL